MFFDESLVSFFRRPSFSPDGSLLFLPCGLFQNPSDLGDSVENCLHVCAYASLLSTPVLAIRGFEKPVLGIRCHPRLFELRRPDDGTLFSLPYRIVYAVFTMDTVMVFDSTSVFPIGHIRDLHYGSLTDACWSPDGSTLFVSSTDGFCSLIAFSPDEPGTPLSRENQSSVISELRQKYAIKVPKKPSMIPATQEDTFMAPSSDPIILDRGEDDLSPTITNPPITNSNITNPPIENTPLTPITTNTATQKRRIQPTLISQ